MIPDGRLKLCTEKPRGRLSVTGPAAPFKMNLSSQAKAQRLHDRQTICLIPRDRLDNLAEELYVATKHRIYSSTIPEIDTDNELSNGH